MADRIIIGGKSFDADYANDPRNQEEIRQAVVNSGNDIYIGNDKGLTNNTTGNTINSDSNGGMTSTGSTYKNDKGVDVTPYSERNNVGNVLGGTIFDPNSSNFNSLIANSGGKINLGNIGDYNSQGIFTGANSGTKSEAESQAYYANIMNGGGSSNNFSGGSSYGSGAYSGGSYGNSATDLNSQLVAAQKANKLAGLQGAYNSSLSNLNTQDAAIDPQAYIDRGQKSTASQLGAKNLAEYLASRNQTNSGMAGQSELTRNMQLQGDIGNIDLQARNTHNDINTSKTNLSNALNTDTAAANAGIEADSLSRQIQLMQQEQARQDQINQFNQQFNYQVNRDTVGDNRYNSETAYNQSRDTVADNRYNDTTSYNQQQDLINQTGQLGNGQYTQSGQLNNLNIQQQQAQLAEMQNPNSVTNQMAKLGLQTAQLNYAALPTQIKAQAQQIAQQLSQGAIDLKTAQLKLNYLPQQMAQETAQNNAQLAATNRSNQNSSSSASTKSSQTSALADATKTLLGMMATGDGSKWLQTYQNDLIDALGVSGYNSLVKNTYNKAVDDQGATKAAKALRNAGE